MAKQTSKRLLNKMVAAFERKDESVEIDEVWSDPAAAWPGEHSAHTNVTMDDGATYRVTIHRFS